MKTQSSISPERAKEIINSVHKAAGGVERRLFSVAAVNKSATRAVRQATKVTKQLATLMRFDEINRLKEKTVSTGRGHSSRHKVKTRSCTTSNAAFICRIAVCSRMSGRICRWMWRSSRTVASAAAAVGGRVLPSR